MNNLPLGTIINMGADEPGKHVLQPKDLLEDLSRETNKLDKRKSVAPKSNKLK